MADVKMKQLRLTVPVEMTRRSCGLSIDMGSSVLKIVYRSKEDMEEASADSGGYGHLELVMFSRDDLSAALDYVRQRAVMTDTDAEQQQQRPTVYTTGIGCTQHGKLIADTLNIKLQQLTEFDCYIKSFVYLAARMPRSELLEPFLDEAIVEPVESIKVLTSAMKKMEEQNISEHLTIDMEGFMKNFQMATGKPSDEAVKSTSPLAQSESDMYPCLVAICGSGFGFIKVEKDGSFKIVDMSNRGGRALYGMGSLIAGCKSFDELLDLASAGNERNVDQFSDAFTGDLSDATEGETSMYTMSATETNQAPVLVFAFGKAIGSELGKFRREDLAHAWLNYVLLDLVQCVQLVSFKHEIKHIFFAGGVCSAPLVRSIITTEYVRRNLSQLMFGSYTPPVPFDFVKPGAHLGALGCIVHDIQQSADKA